MQFLYTGASTYLGQQTDPNLSLGGLISGTIVPNNVPDNIFSDISYQTAQQRRVETRGLILQNITGVDVTDIIFGYTYPATPNFKIEVAFVAINATTPQQIEKISNAQASPYFATFQEANIDNGNSIDNSVDIGDMIANAMIAVWLRRTITGVFTPPSFASVQDEMAFWQALSNPSSDPTKLTNFIIKYTTA